MKTKCIFMLMIVTVSSQHVIDYSNDGAKNDRLKKAYEFVKAVVFENDDYNLLAADGATYRITAYVAGENLAMEPLVAASPQLLERFTNIVPKLEARLGVDENLDVQTRVDISQESEQSSDVLPQEKSRLGIDETSDIPTPDAVVPVVPVVSISDANDPEVPVIVTSDAAVTQATVTPTPDAVTSQAPLMEFFKVITSPEAVVPQAPSISTPNAAALQAQDYKSSTLPSGSERFGTIENSNDVDVATQVTKEKMITLYDVL